MENVIETTAIKITAVACFIFGNGIRVEFLPVEDVPGFTHKVYVLSVRGNMTVLATDWYARKKPAKKDALFYYEKHKETISAHAGTAHARAAS
jgi:hypothetical protein